MPFGTWLTKTRLQRIERKLRKFRSQQRHVREKEEELLKETRRGVPNEKQKKLALELHEEKERLTAQIHALQADEERYRAELKAAGVSTH